MWLGLWCCSILYMTEQTEQADGPDGPDKQDKDMTDRATGDRPNVVLLYLDDAGYGDFGFTGHPSTRTPNIDDMSRQGMRLTTWYSAYPVCTSSRTALMTGRYPPRVGMPGVINSLSSAGLPLKERTIANVLKDKGYSTAAVGKWHLGQLPKYLPLRRGFDAFLGLPFSVDDGQGFLSPCNESNEFSLSSGLGPSLPLPLIRQRSGNGKPAVSEIIEQPTDLRLLTARLLNFSLDFVETHANSPFFLYAAFGHVHTATANINPPLKQYAGCNFEGLTRRGAFGDALAEADHFVGQLMSTLNRLNLRENTFTLFASDNGPSLRWGAGAGSVGLFTGNIARSPVPNCKGTQCCNAWPGGCYWDTGKGSTWEGGVRMPAIAHWPTMIKASSSSAEVVSAMDVLPSVERLVSGTKSTTLDLDGKDSLVDIVLGRGRSGHTGENVALWMYNEPAIANCSRRIFAARYLKYKVHFITSPGLGGGIFPTIHRPPHEVRHDPPLVFDVEQDPSERHPLPLSDELNTMISRLLFLKKQHEESFQIVPISPIFGYSFALCCGVGCQVPCDKCFCNGTAMLPP